MKIHAYIISYNEEKLLPFTLDYYSNFCEKIFVYDNYSTDSSDEIYKRYDKVIVSKFNSENSQNEIIQKTIKSEEYKKYSRNSDVDWVITIDCDEFVYHPNLIEKLKEYKKNGITVIQTSGHEMVCEIFPEYDGELLPNKVKIGSDKMPMLSKSIIFNPNIDINFSVGAHHFSSNHTILSPDEEVKILHYKCLGKEYVTNIYNERYKRLSESSKRNAWNTHYSEINKFLSLMDNILKNNKNIVDSI
jgi:hypothetical protein